MTDKSVTSSEFDQFYGVEPTRIEIEQTIGSAAAEFDAGELADIAYGNFEAIADAIAEGSGAHVGALIIEARNQRIADIASRALYGRIGEINANEVKI